MDAELTRENSQIDFLRDHIFLTTKFRTVILLSQMKFRKSLSGTERDRLAFRMPFYPYSSWLALAFLALVIGLMAYFPDTQVALLVGPLWLVLLTALFYGFRLNTTRTRSSISAEPSFPHGSSDGAP